MIFFSLGMDNGAWTKRSENIVDLDLEAMVSLSDNTKPSNLCFAEAYQRIKKIWRKRCKPNTSLFQENPHNFYVNSYLQIDNK